LSACRPLLARYLVAVVVNLALLGPLAPARLPLPHPIVATGARTAAGEQIRRRRGGVDEIWLVGLPFRPAAPPSPN
jgi:hypothetical protein